MIGNAVVAGSGSLIGNGLRININGDKTARVLVDNNVIRQCPNGRGIEVICRNGTGGADVTVTNNNVNTNDVSGFPLCAILLQSTELRFPMSRRVKVAYVVWEGDCSGDGGSASASPRVGAGGYCPRCSER